MQELFNEFLREKRYLENLSCKTIRYYEWVFNRWKALIGSEIPNKSNTKEFVIAIQESGISVFTANSYIRGMNSFLSWLSDNEKIDEKLRIKKLKEPIKVLRVFSDAQLRKLISDRPNTFVRWRIFVLTHLLIETGARIDELLSLKRSDIDFDNFLLLVYGKGGKERLLPFSIECRKVLYRFLKMHDCDWVLPARAGQKWQYRTALEQFKEWCDDLKVTGVRCSFHTLRHTFASAYIRDGGNVLYLQRLLGHSDIQSTRIYVNSDISDLQMMQKRTSLVSNLKRKEERR
jgi:integrase/recombinase XerD